MKNNRSFAVIVCTIALFSLQSCSKHCNSTGCGYWSNTTEQVKPKTEAQPEFQFAEVERSEDRMTK